MGNPQHIQSKTVYEIEPGVGSSAAPDARDGLKVEKVKNVLGQVPLWQGRWAKSRDQPLGQPIGVDFGQVGEKQAQSVDPVRQVFNAHQVMGFKNHIEKMGSNLEDNKI